MKPAAIILSFLMLFFTAQPLLIHCQQKIEMANAEKNCCGGQTCSKKENPSKQEKKNCTDANACNPFASCSQCQYVHSANTLLSGRFVILEITKLGLGNADIHPGFLKDSWHPPEFV